MFIKIMLSYVLGYLKLSVEGYYIERFINICKNNKITIWNLKRNKEIELYLNVRISEFKKICENNKDNYIFEKGNFIYEPYEINKL